jgi:type II secretory pathway pseudopilin PulG
MHVPITNLDIAKPISTMLIIHAVLTAALLPNLVQACPYLASEQENQAALADLHSHAHQLVRCAQELSKPTSVSEAIETATKQIKQIMIDNKGMDAKFLRLSFHDCPGGCDGCVDLKSVNTPHAGLHLPIMALDPVVQFNQPYLTTGDVWALAGLVAARVTQKDTALPFPLQYYGRPQCEYNDTMGGPYRELPSPQLTTDKLVDYFRRTFGYTPEETVAALGAHSMYVCRLLLVRTTESQC